MIVFTSFREEEDPVGREDEDPVGEIIRRKIENIHQVSLRAFDEPLYCSKSLPQFYQDRFFAPAWNRSSVAQLIASIGNSEAEGLNPLNYHYTKLQEFSNNSPKSDLEKAEWDMMLTDAYLLYISHLLSGKVNPTTINAEWHVSRRKGDPVMMLEQALISDSISSSIRSVLPRHNEYKGLKNALKTYYSIEASEWTNIPDGKVLKKGAESSQIPAIRERLYLLGDLKEKTVNNPNIYDEQMFDAVKHFQLRHGLESEGNVGPQTIKALNITITQRISQIRINMERSRWLPVEFEEFYIMVNIASFGMDVIKDGKLVRTHKIIVGKPYRKTPIFSSKMQYLVLNPTWTIPPGILSNDVIPAIVKDLGYLKKKNITIYDSHGSIIDPATIDWTSRTSRNYTYRQAPSGNNAMGAVKFIFPNNFYIYLHDTPSKELFERTERAFSSGCIRVQDPLALAEYLLNDEVNWNLNRINRIVATLMTQTVPLKQQPNVYLLYSTAWTDSTGAVNFRNDIYQHDNPLMIELTENPPTIF